MKEYLKIANDPILWLMCLPVVIIVAVQAIIFSKKAFQAAGSVELTKKEAKTAFRIGAVSAIGPAVAVFVVMLGMMAVVGGPMTWLRLSVIGAAPTELAASTMGAKAMGVEFGGEGYGVLEYANSVWVMTLNGIGWLLFVGLFTHKLDGLRNKISKGDSKLTGEIGGAATLGIAGSIITNLIVVTIAAIAGNGIMQILPPVVVKAFDYVLPSIFGSMFAMFAVKYPKYGAFAIGLTLFLLGVVKVLPVYVLIPVCVFSTIAFATRSYKKGKGRPVAPKSQPATK